MKKGDRTTDQLLLNQSLYPSYVEVVGPYHIPWLISLQEAEEDPQ